VIIEVRLKVLARVADLDEAEQVAHVLDNGFVDNVPELPVGELLSAETIHWREADPSDRDLFGASG
jgi:hypothetical protein